MPEAAGIVPIDKSRLIDALAHDDTAVRIRAASSLGLANASDAPSFLVECFASPDPALREAARNALVKLGDADVVSLLMDSLRHWNPEARYNVVWTLGELGDAAVCQALGDALKDWDDGVRYGAVSALGKLGCSEAVPHLMAAMHDYDEGVRRQAANILGKIGDVRAIPTLIFALKNRGGWRKSREDIVSALGQLGGPEAVEGLIDALGDDFPTVSGVAAICLGDLGGEEAYKGLVDALPDLEGWSRGRAARALFQIQGLQALPDLLRVLPLWRMNKEGVRRTLKGLKSDELVPAIIDRLQSSDSEEREGAIIALGLVGGADAHRTIVGCLSDADSFVVAASAEGLGELQDTGSVQLLLDALCHKDGVC